MNNFLSASIKINGVKYDAFELDDPCVKVNITQTGDGYIYRKMTVSNPSNINSEQVSEPRVIDAVIPCKESAFLHTIWGCNCNQVSFKPIDKDFAVGDEFEFMPIDGNSTSGYGAPFWDVVVDGKAYLFSLGWTGQWVCKVTRTEDSLLISAGMQFADFYIKPGEEFNLPSACILEGKDGEDAAAIRRRFRRIMMSDGMSPLPKNVKKLPIAIGPYGRYMFFTYNAHWHTYEGQIETIKAAQRMGGIDTYWLDAGWFSGEFPNSVGNYSYADQYKEHGLKPISEAAHKAGMKFMLWFEPYRVQYGTETHREHPDYLLYVDWDEAPVINTGRYCYLLNIGNEKVFKYIYGVISNIIRENGIDYYREDNNFPPLDFLRRNDEPSRDGVNEIKFINNVYRLWDSLREEFPGLIVDNCCSGGRRIDLESMRRSVYLWRCDGGGDKPSKEKPAHDWSQNHTLSLSEYVPYQGTGTWEPDAYTSRSGLTSSCVTQFDTLNPDFDFDLAQKATKELAYYSCYWDGDFYPLTNVNMNFDCFAAYQLAKGDDGYVTVFRRSECKESEFVINFNAVEADSLYELRLSDENRDITFGRATGEELLAGYTVTLPAPQTSLIVEYIKIR